MQKQHDAESADLEMKASVELNRIQQELVAERKNHQTTRSRLEGLGNQSSIQQEEVRRRHETGLANLRQEHEAALQIAKEITAMLGVAWADLFSGEATQ